MLVEVFGDGESCTGFGTAAAAFSSNVLTSRFARCRRSHESATARSVHLRDRLTESAEEN